MKTLCILIVGFACILPAQARSYQAIINDLRVEVKKGDAKVVALDQKIGDLDAWAKDRWEKEQAALKQVEKLKALNKRMFWLGSGVTGLIWVALKLAGRSKTQPIQQPVRTPEPPHPSTQRRRKKPVRK